jgi:hypothetical protein
VWAVGKLRSISSAVNSMRAHGPVRYEASFVDARLGRRQRPHAFLGRQVEVVVVRARSSVLGSSSMLHFTRTPRCSRAALLTASRASFPPDRRPNVTCLREHKFSGVGRARAVAARGRVGGALRRASRHVPAAGGRPAGPGRLPRAAGDRPRRRAVQRRAGPARSVGPSHRDGGAHRRRRATAAGRGGPTPRRCRR